MIEFAKKYREDEVAMRKTNRVKNTLERDCLQIKDKILEDDNADQDENNLGILIKSEEILQWIDENPYAPIGLYEQHQKELHSLTAKFFKIFKKSVD